jgi:nickel superoxide dismutase
LFRWIPNRAQHAQKIIATIRDYFLTQRVKTDQKDDAERLAKHPAVTTASMKGKHHADMKYGNSLRESVEALMPGSPVAKQ